MQLLQFWLRFANHAIYYYDIFHKRNENTDKYKNQSAAAVILIYGGQAIYIFILSFVLLFS